MNSIFRFFLSSNSDRNASLSTFKPLKSVSFSKDNSKKENNNNENNINSSTLLNPDNLLKAVEIPEGIFKEEWLKFNIVEFFNDISLIWGTISKDLPVQEVGEGFPDGIEYRYKIGSSTKSKNRQPKVIKCSALEYVSFVMDFINNKIDSFPSDECQKISETNQFFMDDIHEIAKKLFRIYAIIVTKHHIELEYLDLNQVVNTSFKHFLYFIWMFQLVPEREFMPIQSLVNEIKSNHPTLKLNKYNNNDDDSNQNSEAK